MLLCSMPTVFVTVFKFFKFSVTDQLFVAPIWLSIPNRSSHFLLLKENENKTKLAFVAWISQFKRHPSYDARILQSGQRRVQYLTFYV